MTTLGETNMKKTWFYLCIIESIILIGSIAAFFLFSTHMIKKVETVDLTSYLKETEIHYWQPEEGFIPNAETAKAIGSEIIDNLLGKRTFDIKAVTVKYDEKNRLWLVHKGYLFNQGGKVILSRDTGEIISVSLDK